MVTAVDELVTARRFSLGNASLKPTTRLRLVLTKYRDFKKEKAHLLVGLYPISEHERRKVSQVSVAISVGTFG